MRLLQNKIFATILITIITTLLIGTTAYLNVGNALQEKITDAFFQQTKAPTNNAANSSDPSSAFISNADKLGETSITIVAIDAKSLHEEYGLGRWQNWQRSFYATAIENLNNAGARAIGIDIFYNEKQEGIGGVDLGKILEGWNESETVETADTHILSVESSEETAIIKSPEASTLWKSRAGDSEASTRGSDIQNIPGSQQDTDSLIETLQSYANPEIHPDDLIFVETLRKYDNIVLAKYSAVEPKNDIGLYEITSEKLSIPIISESATLGSINIFPDEDSIIRKSLILTQAKATKNNKALSVLLENFDLKILRKYLHLPQKMPEVSEVDPKFYNFEIAGEIAGEKTNEAEKTTETPPKSHETAGETAGEKTNEVEKTTETPPESHEIAEALHEIIKIPLEDYGRMRINFGPLRQTFPQISFVDIVQNNFDQALVKDRLILIGATDMSLQDNHPVPNEKITPIPGIEIHAHTIQTILDQKFLRPQSFTAQIAAITLITLISTAIFLCLSMPIGILYALLAAATYYIAAQYSFRNGLILDMIHPFAALFLTYIFALIYRYFTELKQKHFLKNAFAHYVNEDVVSDIADHPEKLRLGGEKRVLTIFFSDIINFTELSENMTPRNLTDQMTEYFSVMTEIIMKNGGTLDKYEGDAIMAFFGAPVAYEDHAEHACRTALECRKALKMLHKTWKNEGRPLFDFRTGINTGEVIVGNIGSNTRFNYTVMGDSVNTASRLEQLNKELGTKILVSESVYRSFLPRGDGNNVISDRIKFCHPRQETRGPLVKTPSFQFKKHGPVTIRGKKEPCLVYELIE